MSKQSSTIAAAAASLISELLRHPEFLQAMAPAFAAIGQHIAKETAGAITSRHAADLVPPTDAAIPVQDLCKLLKCSEPTFRKHFIENGKLQYIPAPPNADRRRKYVSAKAWAEASKAVPMRVTHIATAA